MSREEDEEEKKVCRIDEDGLLGPKGELMSKLEKEIDNGGVEWLFHPN